MLVLDASIALSWCFEDESTPAGRQVLSRLDEDAGLVPSHWYLEIVNALVIAERRRRITAARVDDYLHQLSVLEIEVDHRASERAFEQLLPLCRAHQLTSYDAAYLDLAHRHRLPLATCDIDLGRAAAQLGVPVLGLS
jgi:predicted nucleic acid-binding protein